MTSELFVDAPDQLRSEILRICVRLLELPDLTIDDDFFDKGGDLLLATELMLELRQLTGKASARQPAVRKLHGHGARREARRKGSAAAQARGPGRRGVRWRNAAIFLPRRLDERRILRRASRSKAGAASFAHRGCASWPGGEPIPGSIEEMAADRLPGS